MKFIVFSCYKRFKIAQNKSCHPNEVTLSIKTDLLSSKIFCNFYKDSKKEIDRNLLLRLVHNGTLIILYFPLKMFLFISI